jgi:branched-chain amino acid transport system permease protein
MSFAYWEPVIIVALINVTIMCGLCINAMSGIISMATAAVAGIGGYAAGILTANFGWHFVPALMIAWLTGALIGMLIASLTLQMKDFVLKLTTLAFGEAVTVVAYNIDYIGGANAFTGVPFYTDLTTAFIIAVIAIYVLWRFSRSRIGMACRAVRDDVAAAQATGISVARTRLTSFAVGAGIVAVGGGVQAHYLSIVVPQDMGFFNSFIYVIFLLVGGSYSLMGPLTATVVQTAAPEFLRFAGQYRLVLFGALVLAIVLFRPQGLIGRRPTGRASRIASWIEPVVTASERWLPAPVRAVLRRSGVSSV